MLTHSTRRWLAGLGVAGAIVTAAATPASAEESAVDLGLYFADTTLAVGSEGKIDSPILYSSEPVVLHGLSVRYDYRDLAGKVTVKPEGTPSGDCASPEENVLVCTDPFEVGLDDWGMGGYFSVVLAPTGDAKDGDTGELKVTVGAEGATSATHTAKVRVGEGVDLAGRTEVKRSAAPGGTFTAPLTVRNVGTTTAKGAVVIFDHDRAIRPSEKFNNCTYEGDELRTCRFDSLTAAPGENWTSAVNYTLGKDTYAPGKEYGYHNWMTVAEFEDFAAYLDNLGISVGKPGNGGNLTLTKAGALSGFQADTNPDNNWSGMEVSVTGKNGVDLAAIGDSVTGKAGEVVNATVGVRNNGPASLDFNRSGSPVTKIDVTVPTGTTAVEVPEVCVPFDGKQEDWDNAGKPGEKAYRCWPDLYIAAGEEQTVEFGLRIDKVVPNATGTVTINAKCECEGFTEDIKPANDTAKLLVNATGGNGGGDGGGDGGTLPITGESTALVAGIGGLLLAAGVGGYVVARRRRTRFVA
ncbi:LPXTG cell wall anchor domain-containing protein [Micromonospora sp. U56]|uniref:LPXTG cell wall anchor domain-containing protein n=1 Tax=Micromonospora sp. U56 TaxID=2824900 RepID=UPI001B372F4E|nr:LPXTG cell wall anchor domain-containing protein [Micromonospora sp. U56]MBQ0896685.1 LPXTG cell wall anchor domain-containing protein [Micromonospora sp. U56]